MKISFDSLPPAYRRMEQWSWVIAFILLCGFIYERSWNRYRLEHASLTEKRIHLEDTIEKAEREQTELLRHLASREDWDWRELVIKEQLGMVAEGEIRVFFKEKRSI